MTRFLIFIVLLCITFGAHAEPRKKKESILDNIGLIDPDAVPVPATSDSPIASSTRVLLSSTARYINVDHREGIDVSHFQGRINWAKVAKEGKVSYAYIKCTEGATIQDEYYRYNVEEARKAKISVGAYHFYRPNTPIADQLANMAATAKKSDMDLVPIIDVEVRGSDDATTFLNNLQRFIDLVEKHYGKRPMLYTGQNFYNKHLLGKFRSYAWMIAKYQELPPVLNDNLDYNFWQYTSKARVPGISGNVDRSCLMEAHELKDISM